MLDSGGFPHVEAVAAGDDARTLIDRLMEFGRDDTRFERGSGS